MPKYDLVFDPPVMNAAGSLGFAPELRGVVDLKRLGAFVTNPISLQARTPAHGQKFVEFPGGFLLHSGHPNPGFSRALKRYGPRWARAPLPVLVHLIVRQVADLGAMLPRLEKLEGVLGIELGLPDEIQANAAADLARAAIGELPLVVRLPLERSLELAPAVVAAGAAAVSLGPPRGALPVERYERTPPAKPGQERLAPSGECPPGEGLLKGRLYGPAIFPTALWTVGQLAQMDLPVIGAGGVYHDEQVQAMLAAGALAVQLDAALWGSW